jgi:hypothetical protein
MSCPWIAAAHLQRVLPDAVLVLTALEQMGSAGSRRAMPVLDRA